MNRAPMHSGAGAIFGEKTLSAGLGIRRSEANPSWGHASVPPRSTPTLDRPAVSNMAAALAERRSVLRTTITGFPLAASLLLAVDPLGFAGPVSAKLLRPERQELNCRLEPGGISLIDVREPDEFLASPGHLPGALNIPLADVAVQPARHL